MSIMQLFFGPALKQSADNTPAPTPGLMAFIGGHFPYNPSVTPGPGNIRGPIPLTGVPLSYNTRQFKGLVSGDVSFYAQDVAQAPVPVMAQSQMSTVKTG